MPINKGSLWGYFFCLHSNSKLYEAEESPIRIYGTDFFFPPKGPTFLPREVIFCPNSLLLDYLAVRFSEILKQVIRHILSGSLYLVPAEFGKLFHTSIISSFSHWFTLHSIWSRIFRQNSLKNLAVFVKDTNFSRCSDLRYHQMFVYI